MRGRYPLDDVPQVSHSARIIGWALVVAIAVMLAYLTLAGGSAKAADAPAKAAEQDLATLLLAACPSQDCVLVPRAVWNASVLVPRKDLEDIGAALKRCSKSGSI